VSRSFCAVAEKEQTNTAIKKRRKQDNDFLKRQNWLT
jgi:hypothetical protein